MKLKSTADGLKAVKETLEEILSKHTTGKGGLIDNQIYVPFDDALLAMAEAYGLNRNQPLEVKEQAREEAETEDEKFWNNLAGECNNEDDDRTPHEEYLDAVIDLRKQDTTPEAKAIDESVEESATDEDKYWNGMADKEHDAEDDNRTFHEEYLDAIISLQNKEASNPELGVEEAASRLTDSKFPDSHNYLHSQPFWYKQGCIDALKQQQQGLVSKDYEKALKYEMGLMQVWHKAFHTEASLIEIARMIDEILDRKSNY